MHLDIQLPYVPVIPVPVIYSREKKTYAHVNVYSSFIHNHQKLEKPSISFKWQTENCDRYIHTKEYYSAIKMKELLIHASTWFTLK